VFAFCILYFAFTSACHALMRILFVLNRMAHVRHFDRSVRLLADRGHDVCLASQDDDVELSGVLAGQERIRATAAPRNRSDDWVSAATALRRARDYIRYLHPRYASAGLLRSRAFEKLVASVSDHAEGLDDAWSELLLRMPKPEQKRIDALLTKLETAIPTDPGIDAFLDAERPDVVILSPMVGIGFTQADFVKSARARHVPTGMLVFSWDNLSNKGLIHEIPDRILVWNQTQSVEAVKLHRCPADRIVVTGAPRFDPFFEMKPATRRDEFCRLVELDPSRSLITYLCSSKFVAAEERTFVERWIAEIRRSADPRLARTGVIVRPHPAGMKGWHADSRRDFRWPGAPGDKATVSKPFADPDVAVMHSPMQNADIVLYDTVFHSAAVVGLNTSAEIEAAIVGRPVFTIIDPDAKGQQGTLHFHYLLKSHGGHVELAESFDDHRAQLSRALAGEDNRGAIDTFLVNFIRPKGLAMPVAPIVADAVEDLAARHAGAATPALASGGDSRF
jgi:hypothetical protein